LCFLTNEEEDGNTDQQAEFTRIRKMKNNLTPAQLCSESDEGKNFEPFVTDIFKLDFAETPNYDKLRFTLIKGLLNLNETPNKVYDWNEEYLRVRASQQPAT